MTLPGLDNVFGGVEHVVEDVAGAMGKVITKVGSLFADNPPQTSQADQTKKLLWGPEGPPPQAPAPSEGGGGLSAGAAGAGDTYNRGIDASAITDDKLSQVLTQIFANNQAARDKITSILGEIKSGAVQVGPHLGDPAAVNLFQQFLDQKLGEVQKVLDDAQVDAKTQAAILAAIGQDYHTIGPHDGSDNGKGGKDGGGDGSGGGGGGGGGSSQPGGDGGGGDGSGGGGDGSGAEGDGSGGGTGGTDPTTDPLAGIGPPAMGEGMDPLLSSLAPALAGLAGQGAGLGGALGGANPLGALGPALSGLGQSIPAIGDQFSDRGAPDHKPDDSFTDNHDDPKSGGDKSGSQDPGAKQGQTGSTGGPGPANNPGQPAGNGGTPAAAPGAVAPPGAVPAGASSPGPAPASGSTTVTMPDGSAVTVGDTKAAEIMKAVMSGKNVTAAYHDIAGADLPPPGTPVTDPQPPSQLQPTYLARFQDREPVMFMGNGKIWLDGQLQPISALGSPPDFLGWTKPPASPAPAPPPGTS